MALSQNTCMHMACRRGCGPGTTNTPYYVVVRRSYSYASSSMRYIDRLAGLQPSTVMRSRVLGLPTLVSEYVNGTATKHMYAHSRVLGLPTLVSGYVNGTVAKHMDAHSRVLGLPTLVSEYVNGTTVKHMDEHGMPRVWPRHYQHPILRSSTPIVQLRW